MLDGVKNPRRASQLREMFASEHEHPPSIGYYLFSTTIGLLLD
jgi:hypothetical protein